MCRTANAYRLLQSTPSATSPLLERGADTDKHRHPSLVDRIPRRCSDITSKILSSPSRSAIATPCSPTLKRDREFRWASSWPWRLGVKSTRFPCSNPQIPSGCFIKILQAQKLSLHPASSRSPYFLFFVVSKAWIPEVFGSSPGMATDDSRGSKPSLLLSTLPNKLPAEFLKEITDGFSADRKLGHGAFGTVYKGYLQDGQPIAVKKLAENSPVAPEKQFQNEVGNLMAIRHENIVRLVGYCHEMQKKVIEHNGRYILVDVVESLLCYEYAPNGNLDKYLFDEPSRPNWATCFKIIKGICQGLQFLHKGTDRPIVHLDLQPANILLAENMVPKIADFGLSRLFGEEQTRINTINVVGAKGYMAPEYLYRGEISTRSDIYSLGVLIIEITIREKNFSSDKDMSARDFIDKVRQTWTDEHIASKYSSLDAGSLQEVKTCIGIGLQCVDIDQKKRPPIDEIVAKLDGRHPH